MARDESLGGRGVCGDAESIDAVGRKPRLRCGMGVVKGFSGGLALR